MYDNDELTAYVKEKWPLTEPVLLAGIAMFTLIGPASSVYMYGQGETIPAIFILALSSWCSFVFISLEFRRVKKRKELKRIVRLLSETNERTEVTHLVDSVDSFDEEGIKDLTADLEKRGVIRAS